MNTALIVRIAKFAALFCFVLPWFMVSCNGTPIPNTQIAGYELITGQSAASSQMASQMGAASAPIGGGNFTYQIPFTIAAAAIVLGIVLSFTMRGGAAGRGTLITSIVSAAAVIGGYLLLQNAIKSGMNQASAGAFGGGGASMDQFNSQMNQMSQAMLAGIDLQPQMGYWLTIVCLAAAGVFSFLQMRGQEAFGGAGASASFAPAGAGPRTADVVEWESMNQFDTDRLADFLMKYPGSRFARTAQDNLARISAGGGTAPDADADMWGRIDQNDPEQLADYLMKFPGGRNARTAQAKMQASFAPAPSAAPPAAAAAPSAPTTVYPPPPAYTPPPAPSQPTPMAAAPPSYSDGSYDPPPKKGLSLILVVAIAAIVLGGAAVGGYIWWQNNERTRIEAEQKAASDQAAAAALQQQQQRQAAITACTSTQPDALDAAVTACLPLLWEADQAVRETATSHINQVAAMAALTARQRVEQVPEFTDLAAFFVDRGVCPGEGCLYGMWTATQATPLYASPADPRVIGSIEANERVLAATGEVQTLPVRGAIARAFEGHNAGDTVYRLTAMGEGAFRIWHNGSVSWATEEANCDPAAQPGGCALYDFGADNAAQSVWWAQVRRQNGETGWVRDTANFTGKSRHD